MNNSLTPIFYVIANIQAPSGLRSAEDEVEEGTEEDVTEESSEETESE